MRPRTVGSAIAVLVVCLLRAEAQPVLIPDPVGDAVVRRTDDGGDGNIDPATQRLPDIIEMRIGLFTPVAPHVDLFDGAWTVTADFFRFDIVLQGLVNPPGPLAFDDVAPVYDPFFYGPHPIFGFIEFDADVDPDTGGELNNPDLRYLGNVARFGGHPTEGRFAGRVAQDDSAFDGDVTTAPFVDRSGEEFHIAFLGEEIERIDVVLESPGGDEDTFEDGEIWQIETHMFHRAHGFEAFAFSCPGEAGVYKPDAYLQFAHNLASDQTTVSLVYPLTNAGSAAMIDPGEPVESNNGCDYDQNSVEEALQDLWFSAFFADPFDRILPEFQLIAGWEFNNVADHLDPTLWPVACLVGTAYGSQSEGARYIWTDVVSDPCVGDFNGDGTQDTADILLLDGFIAAFDGDPAYDDDGSATNASIDLRGFAANFSLFDTNYDGFIDATDAVVPGDMDLNRVVDVDDIDDFVQALLDPATYMNAHNGIDPVVRGDLDHDGTLSGGDIPGLLVLILDSGDP